MGSLQSTIADNLGGMRWCKWVNCAFVSAMTKRYDHSVESITLAAGYDWEELYTSIESIDVKHTIVSGPSGDAHKTTIDLFVPGSIKDFESRLEALSKGKFVVAVNDWDDALLIAGSKENGCNCSIAYDSTSKISGLKGTKISFSVTTKHLSHSIARSVLFP